MSRKQDGRASGGQGGEKVGRKRDGKRASGKRPATIQKKLAGMKVWQLLALLVLVVGGVVLFVGAASGWFSSDTKVVLNAEYYCGDSCDGEYMELAAWEYEELVREGKSFVVFVDQNGCTTADRLRVYVRDFANEAGVRVYRMMFSEVKKSSLGEAVKYYPSVAVVSQGKVVGYLRADSDEDAGAYNDYDAFKGWMGRYRFR